MSNPTEHFRFRKSRPIPGPFPARARSASVEVCKYIDVTTCIGCKACEVACVEWNDHPFRETTFDNTYQTMPSTEWNYWNLIKFNEHQRDDGTLMWLMRKDQCMHCEDPGCLRACPADGAIVKYTNGIVDFQQENCIGCRYCISGCPFDIPKFNPTTKKVFKCTLCSDRVGQGLEPACIKACPTGCLQFGTKTDMGRSPRRARSSCASNRDSRMRASTIRRRSAARTSSMCCTTSRSRSCTAGCRPIRRFPPAYTVWKWLAKPIGLLLALLAAPVAFFHYIMEGPKEPQPPSRRSRDDGAVETGRRGARGRRVDGFGRTVVHEGELLRHPVYTRVLHWGVAIFFVLALLSGLRRSTRRGSSAG